MRKGAKGALGGRNDDQGRAWRRPQGHMPSPLWAPRGSWRPQQFPLNRSLPSTTVPNSNARLRMYR